MTSGAIALSFLSLQAALTPAGAFGLFAGIAAIATVFAILVLPETKGRSLEELEQELSELRLCGPNQPSARAGSGSGTPDQHEAEPDGEEAPVAPGWVRDVERTVGLHSSGGVGMQRGGTEIWEEKQA